jgi:hypothetical protein
VRAVQKATEFDDRDVLHVMRYGAAAALISFEDNEIVTACQRKAVEYGAAFRCSYVRCPSFLPDGIAHKFGYYLVDQFESPMFLWLHAASCGTMVWTAFVFT